VSNFHQVKSLLQELSNVEPDAEITRRAMASTREALVRDGASQRTTFWSFSITPMKIAVPAVVVLLFSTLIIFSLISASTANVSYAEVIAVMERVKTIQYLETRTGKSPDGKLNSPTEVTKVTVLGRSMERKEVISVKDGDPLTDGGEWAKPVVGMVSISDLKRGKYVSLNLNTKTLYVVKSFTSIAPDAGTVNTTKTKPAPEVDLYKRVRDFAVEESEQLAVREIDGKEAVGFRTIETFQRKRGVDTRSVTYWIDSKTRLPIKIEATSKSTDPFMGQSRWVLSDMVFDEPIDESLFSTEPPNGYTVVGE